MIFRNSVSYARQIGRWVAILTLVTSVISNIGPAAFAAANVLEYDASSGLLPQSLGWSYSDQATPPASATVSGGSLTLRSEIGNRAGWDLYPVPGILGNAGSFMETTARIVSEQHTHADRGTGLAQIGHANGVVASSLDLYAWKDRISVNDANDITVGTHVMDTTDAFHTYRVELLFTQYWVFVDDKLALTGTTPVAPSALNGIAGSFGDGSVFSGGITEWAKVRIGSLADIGGPTVPEPSTFVLASLATGIFAWQRRSRRDALITSLLSPK